jgi:cytochrome P450
MAELAESNQDYWTPQVISQSMLGIWFAASHQPWMNLDFVLPELCVRPEWQSLLREEIGDYATVDYARLEKLPLLDSFIKETVRLNPLDTSKRSYPTYFYGFSLKIYVVAIRRKALSDYTFSAGAPFIPAGSTVCVSSYDVLHDQRTYPRPNEFDGRRFAVSRESSRFTDVSERFPIWGFGSLAW